MTILRNLVCRISLMMAATVSVPFGYAATPSAGMSADEAITEAADGMALYQAHCAACHDCCFRLTPQPRLLFRKSTLLGRHILCLRSGGLGS